MSAATNQSVPPTRLASAVWAFAKLGHYDGALMNGMAAEATRRITEFRWLASRAWGRRRVRLLPAEAAALLHAQPQVACHSCPTPTHLCTPQPTEPSHLPSTGIFIASTSIPQAASRTFPTWRGPTPSWRTWTTTCWLPLLVGVELFGGAQGCRLIGDLSCCRRLDSCLDTGLIAEPAGSSVPWFPYLAPRKGALTVFNQSGCALPLAGRAEGMVDELNMQHCTNLVWAYATLLGPASDMLPTVLAGKKSLSLAVFLPSASGGLHAEQSLSTAASSGCKLLSSSRAFLHQPGAAHCLPNDPAAAEVKARMGAAQFNVQQVANLLWSMAISGRCDREAWRLSLGQVGQHYCCLAIGKCLCENDDAPSLRMNTKLCTPGTAHIVTELCRKSCLLDCKLRCAKQQHNHDACQMELPPCSWRPWQSPSPSCQQRHSRRWGIREEAAGCMAWLL